MSSAGFRRLPWPARRLDWDWIRAMQGVSVDNLYSLYDAPASIQVPSGKARALVDAMEPDMGATLATKQDLPRR